MVVEKYPTVLSIDRGHASHVKGGARVVGQRVQIVGQDLSMTEGFGDAERLQLEVFAGREQINGDPVASEFAKREHCLQGGHSTADDDHAFRLDGACVQGFAPSNSASSASGLSPAPSTSATGRGQARGYYGKRSLRPGAASRDR